MKIFTNIFLLIFRTQILEQKNDDVTNAKPEQLRHQMHQHDDVMNIKNEAQKLVRPSVITNNSGGCFFKLQTGNTGKLRVL